MKKLTPDDLLPTSEYVRVRDDYRRKIIEYKKNRRISVGPQMTFVFENRKTMKFQLQEILRAEDLTAPEEIAGEVAVYNPLLPGDGELSATLLIEFTATSNVRREMDDFLGVTRSIALCFGDHRVPAVFEEGRETDEKISAVQYARFIFDDAARKAFLETDAPAELVVDHTRYAHRTQLTPGMRESLRADLQGRGE